MVQLTFYGGINEIGGNKVLLEDNEGKLFLDFGFPYKRHKLFYEEYLKPRSGAGLLDPLAMGLLPPLEGLYRDDLETPVLWQDFRNASTYRKLERLDGVLLSHAHLDHSGYIAFLREDIPVYATAVTAFITKAMQDSGKSDFDQQVCYFSPTTREYPTGWKQTAYLTSNVANILMDLGISYEYEKPLYSKTDAKDFRLPDFTVKYEGEEFFWEHLGMLFDPEYKAEWENKEKWYKENGYYDRVIISKDGPDGRIDSKEIEKLAKEKILGIKA